MDSLHMDSQSWKMQMYMFWLIMHTCLCVDLTYYIQEGKRPGTYVGDIAADSHLMDSISSQNTGMISFSKLQQGEGGTSQLFNVFRSTGKLYTAQTLDAESMCKREKECFKMVDVAVRQAESFMKILEIKVVIQDVNDHEPEFPDKQVNIEFSENDREGTKVSIPNAIDKDVGVLNSQMTYELKKNKNEPFTLAVSKSIDGTSKLAINLKDRLDRESKDSYQVQVIAKDGGNPPKQSILNVAISVSDVNDNAPMFSMKTYNVSVKNEQSEILPIIILSAKDLDSGKNGKIVYQFSPQTSEYAKTHFKLNKVTGEIFLFKKFTLGQELTYKLYVEATDGGSPPLSSITMVLVNVINQQNNAPTIDLNFFSSSKKNTISISEDIKVGSFIAYVKVTDHDVGQNGEVTCDLHHDKFQLRSLGKKKYKIIVKSQMDREVEDHNDLIITCQDKGFPPLHSESKFSIIVLDINDVKPLFSKEIFKFYITENQKPNTPVGYINASDPDLGPGGKLSYSLLTTNKRFLPFQITYDGFISTIMSLDHEFQDNYEFQVLAKDNGIPSLNKTVKVIVEVKDQNDNAPYFTFPSVNPFTLDVVYYLHYTNNITVLKASDRDSQENAFLKYEITAGNDNQLYTINHYTGLLSFTRVVTQQDAGSYELEFVVKDSGTPVLSATTIVFLTLTVSNKTSEMFDTISKKTNDKIHLNFAVVIVFVAVSISVATTASMSLCIIRCSSQRNTQHRNDVNHSNKCVSEQGHLMCPSYQRTSWPDISVAMTTDSDKTKNCHMIGQRKVSYHGSEKDSASALELRTSTEIRHQMCIQEATAPPDNEKNENNSIIFPDNYSWRSIKSSPANGGHIWKEDDTGQIGEMLDLLTPQYSFPPKFQTDQLPSTDMKPLQELFDNHSDAAAPARSSYKSNIDQSVAHNEWSDVKMTAIGNDSLDINALSKDIPMNNHHIPNFRPLPSVPQTPY